MAIFPLSFSTVNSALQTPGAALTASQFTFSIPGSQAVWPEYAAGTEPTIGYQAFTTQQADYFRQALRSWDELIAPNFTEVADTATSQGVLRAAFSANFGPNELGHAYQAPGPKAGDIWINLALSKGILSPGSVGYEALIHEIGHTLGLKHPFESPALPTQYDSTDYTVMSYTQKQQLVTLYYTGGSYGANFSVVTALTPMVADIIAVQSLYGADTTTRTGNDVYQFTQGEVGFRTIYDAGGTDTINLINFDRPVNLDLHPGAYSDIGIWTLNDQIAALKAQTNQLDPVQAAAFQVFEHWVQATLLPSLIASGTKPFFFTGNLAIAFGVTIENAVGGSGNDTLTGNEVDNNLFGSFGNDVLIGNGGNDTLAGSFGIDTITGGNGADLFVLDGGDDLSPADTVTDFTSGEDKLQVTRGRYFIGSAAFGGHAGEVRLGTADSVPALLLDLNGDKVVDYTVKLTGGLAPTASDFVGLFTNPVFGTSADNLFTATATPATYVGGLGNDTYFVNPADAVVEDAGGGTDMVMAIGSFVLPADSEIELLQAWSSGVTPGIASAATTPADLTGSNTPNQLMGNNGVNRLDGRGGNDSLRGFAGADTLIGGAGDDTLDGGAGADEAVFTVTRNSIVLGRSTGHWITIGSVPEGTDTIQRVEQFRFADGLFSFTFGRGGAPVVANFNPAFGWASQDQYPRHVADVNGDGYADIVGFGTAGVLVSFGSAGGSFTGAAVKLADFGQNAGWATDNGFHRELADVNGDGRADILGFGFAGTLVSLAKADGMFGTVGTGITDFGVNQGWTSDNSFHRAVADVNGDGRADIVGFGIAGTYVALANADGTFANAQLVLNDFGATQGWASNDSFSRLVADVNADHIADIIGFGTAGTLIAFGKGDGTFTQASLDVTDFGKNQGWSSDNTFHREVADINKDGLADIVGFGIAGVLVGANLGDFLI